MTDEAIVAGEPDIAESLRLRGVRRFSVRLEGKTVLTEYEPLADSFATANRGSI